MEDIVVRARLAYGCFWLYKAAVTVIGSVIGNLKLFWWGIPVAGPVKAVGLFRIEKHPGATIRIGRKCCFRSARCSNIAGINRPVLLAARKSGRIEIGDHCGLSATVIVADTSVKIGNRVMIGVNCTIADTDFHPVAAEARFAGERGKTLPITIGDDVFIGMNSMVLKGVTIGRGSVIAAGSVVTKDLPPGVLAGGVPAKVIRRLPDAEA